MAILFHYRYIRIHPFEDGNGRIARLMFNYIPIATRLSDDCGIQQIEKNATYSYLQEVIGINRSAIQKMIQALQGKGYIDRDESGSWRVFITPSVL